MQNKMPGANQLKIFSVYHKEAYIPDAGYIVPVQAGRAVSGIDLGMAADDEGDNISSLNPSFCELTVMYNVWKNNRYLPAQFWGLCHYRRYFTTDIHWTGIKKKDIYFLPAVQKNYKKVFSAKLQNRLLHNLREETAILAKPIQLKTEDGEKISMKAHYCKDHDPAGWEAMANAVNELYPAYTKSFEEKTAGNQLSCFNMMIAHHTVWAKYLAWLMDIVNAIHRTYTPPDNVYQSRAIGFMAERLMNVYFYHHRNEYKLFYMPVALFI